MIKIGVVNIDTSHPKTFAEYLSQGNRARYEAIFNDGFREDDEVEAFIAKCGMKKRCNTVEEMVDLVDVGFIQGCNWDKHIEYAMPFINKDKPVFIDKPVVGSLKDCLKIEELARNGKVILGSSSVRYAYEIAEFLAIPEEERGKIVHVSGTSGVDEFNYAIHIVEAFGGLLGTGADSAKYIGRAERDGKICESYFIKYNNGITATYDSFINSWMPFNIVIMTTKTIYSFRIDTKKIYGSLLDKICDYMESGDMKLAPVEDLTESIRIMLAARISRDKKNGEEVKITDIPLDDEGYNGYKFEKEYAAAAKKLYL